MSGSLGKSLRQIHRWLALPFVVLLLALALARGTELQLPAQRAQQVLMLTMALTGLYLFALPWWARWRRRRRALAPARAGRKPRLEPDNHVDRD